MSLKIRSGYMFKENLSLLELNTRMKDLRKLFTDEIQKHYRRQLISLICLYEDLYQIDRTFCIEKLKKLGYMHKIEKEETSIRDIAINVNFNYRESVLKSLNSPIRNPLMDYNAQVQIYPIMDKILLQFFGESWLEDIFQRQEDILDYHYQNASDKPEEISETEWNQRYADWKEAIPTWLPARSGFTVNLFLEEDVPFMMDQIFLPGEYDEFKVSLKDRIDSVVEHYFVYPEFDGYNWEVFLEKEYHEFKKKKAEIIKELLENRPDPLVELYETYARLAD